MGASIHLEWCLVGAIGAVDLAVFSPANTDRLVANIVKNSVRDAQEFIASGAVVIQQCEAELTSLLPNPNVVQVGCNAYPNAHNAATVLVKHFCRISRRWAGIEPAGTDLALIETNWHRVAEGLRTAFLPEEETRIDARNLGIFLDRERYGMFKLIDKPDGVFPVIRPQEIESRLRMQPKQ